MRQPVMAPGTRLVSLVERDLLDARRVARLTRRHVAQRELELVRLVAAGAGGRTVRAVIRLGELVTRSASADLNGLGHLGRVRIMAAHALAGLCRVVGVHGLVARRAGRRRRRTHVVRRVTVGATVVCGDAAAADHVHLRVAVATRHGCLFLERVRLVTAGACRVPARKQGRCRNDGLLFRVTRDARRECVFGRRVPVLVAGRAGFNQRFTLRRVAGRDLLVTIGAGGRLRRPFVRLVAAETGLRAVHLYRRESAHLNGVAAFALRRLITLDCEPAPTQACVDRSAVNGDARGLGLQRFFAARPLECERVAVRAHRLGSRTEALGGFRRRVLDVSFFFVARRAAIGRHWPHLVRGRSVALRTFDLLVLNVNAMTRDIASKAPGLVDIHASAPLPVMRYGFLAGLGGFFLVRAGGERREQEYWDQHPCKQ